MTINSVHVHGWTIKLILLSYMWYKTKLTLAFSKRIVQWRQIDHETIPGMNCIRLLQATCTHSIILLHMVLLVSFLVQFWGK